MDFKDIKRGFLEDKVSLISLIIILFIGFFAIYAPIIANNKPFLIYTDSRVIYLDFLDSATSTLEVISRSIKDNKPIDKKFIKWAVYCFDEAIDFMDYSGKEIPKFDDFNLNAYVKNKDIKKIDDAVSILKTLNDVPLKKRFFTPLFNSLTFLDYFIMILPLVFFLLRKFYKKVLKKEIRTFRTILYSLILTTIFSSIVSIIKVDFPYYNYKNLIKTSNSIAFFPIIPYGENENIITESKQVPTFLLKNKSKDQHFHLLGTDTNGRDVLTRMIYGARISMSIGFIAVGIAVIIGIIVGAAAGYYGGWVDIFISRFMEIVICFPVFFLILSIMAFLRPNIFNVMVVIGLTGWPSVARLVRGEFLRLREFDFVKAAKALGATDLRIIIRHILPNGITPVLVSATFGIAGAVLLEAGLSFLGFGVPQPTASWGDILNNGRDDIYGAWHLTLFPGIAIFLTVTGFNLIGEKLRDLLDPRKR